MKSAENFGLITYSLVSWQVKAVFDTIAPAVGLSVGLAVGQTSIAAETAQLVRRPRNFIGKFGGSEDLNMNSESSVDVLIATPGRLMDHISCTKGFTLEHLCYLVC